MKFAILGSTGFIGKAINQHLLARKLDFVECNRSDFDLYNPRDLKAFLIRSKATHLINAAGSTGKPNVDACELVKYKCLEGNAVFPGIIREVCEDIRYRGGMSRVDVFTLAEDLMEEDGRKKMSPIFLFGHLLVVFTAAPKL